MKSLNQSKKKSYITLNTETILDLGKSFGQHSEDLE